MERYPLIVDNGTGYIKLGYANQDFPQGEISSVIGRRVLRAESIMEEGQLEGQIYFGNEAIEKRNQLELSFILSEGIIRDWEGLEKLWGYCFKQIGCETKDESILITEAVLNPMENRDRLAEIVFEKYEFSQAIVEAQAVLSLFAEGAQTGLVIDSGDGVSHSVAITENLIQKHYIEKINIAGRHVTNHLIDLLKLRGYQFNSTADFQLVKHIKEQTCFVSANLNIDNALALQTTCHDLNYTLPDGSTILIGRERFIAPEILFNPNHYGYDYPQNGIAEMALKTLQQCPIDYKKKLAQFVLISGGSSMFGGFPTRLENDLNKKYHEKNQNSNLKLSVIDPTRRKYNVFIGATVLAKIMMSQSEQSWITREDYKELGSRCLRKSGATQC